MSELFKSGPNLREDAALKSRHVEQEIGVVLAIDRDETGLPLDGGDGSGQPVLHVPEDSTSKVDIMLHQPHAGISGPTLPIVVAHNVLIVGVGVLRQVALDQISRLLSSEAEEHVDPVDVAGVESDGVRGLSLHILIGQEVVRHLRGACHLTGTLQAQHQQVQHQTVVLHYEGGELQTTDNAIGVGVVHVLGRSERSGQLLTVSKQFMLTL